MKTPTDLRILNLIFKLYSKTFESFSKESKTRETKIYVPINIDTIGNKLKVDGDIIFGRLYYHLNKIYSYWHDDGSKVEFFSRVIGNDINCIQFPLMVSVLADLKYENRKFKVVTIIAIISLIISLISITISIFS
jgi:hypothetical protein